MTISEHRVESVPGSRELIDTLQRNLPQLPHERIFPWLYLANPHGCALAWIATDPKTHRVVGQPRRFRVDYTAAAPR